MSETFRKVVRVQMKRIDDGGKVLYSNHEQVSILMEQSGYLVFEMYEGDNLIATSEQWVDAKNTFSSHGVDLVITND